MLEEKEIEVLHLLTQAWNEFSNLSEHHPSDLEEFAHHLHVLQRQILARAGRRYLKETENPVKAFDEISNSL